MDNYRAALHWAREVAQPGSASHWGCGGRRFESCLPDQWFNKKAGSVLVTLPAFFVAMRCGLFRPLGQVEEVNLARIEMVIGTNHPQPAFLLRFKHDGVRLAA